MSYLEKIKEQMKVIYQTITAKTGIDNLSSINLDTLLNYNLLKGNPVLLRKTLNDFDFDFETDSVIFDINDIKMKHCINSMSLTVSYLENSKWEEIYIEELDIKTQNKVILKLNQLFPSLTYKLKEAAKIEKENIGLYVQLKFLLKDISSHNYFKKAIGNNLDINIKGFDCSIKKIDNPTNTYFPSYKFNINNNKNNIEIQINEVGFSVYPIESNTTSFNMTNKELESFKEELNNEIYNLSLIKDKKTSKNISNYL